MRYLLFVLIFFSLEIQAFSATVTGIVRISDSSPLPMATVLVKNKTMGVATDSDGKYSIELEPGTYTLVFSYIGYENVEKTIQVYGNRTYKIDVTLLPKQTTLNEIEIVADRRERANRIMDDARAMRSEYLNNVKNYVADSYVKTTVNHKIRQKPDSTAHADSSKISLATQYETFELSEYIAETHFEAPNRFREIIEASDSYQKPHLPYGFSIIVGEQMRERNEGFLQTNPYIYYGDNLVSDFSLYENLIDFQHVCKQPVKSPIGFGSGVNYKFTFVQTLTRDSATVHEIKVVPRLNSEALFSGTLFIEDGSWALRYAGLSVAKASLQGFSELNISIKYAKIDSFVFLPDYIELNYAMQEGKDTIRATTEIRRTNYRVNTPLAKTSNELKQFKTDAFDKDSAFWANNRPIKLKTDELKFMSKNDSIIAYYTSDKYLDKMDSLFNRITWWVPLEGIGYKNHYKGIEMSVGGILEQIVPFGVGGYRHRLPFYINKEFKNSMLIETTEQLDYGFRNKDFKGKIGVGLTYYPKKFVRTFVNVGSTYELINNYASVEQTFSRSNYVNEQSLEIKQRGELFNGFYAEVIFNYAKQIPINNLELEEWSRKLFGELNTPVEFEPYTKTEVRANLKYRIGQKYVIRKNKKFIIGQDYPEIFLNYRKGIPDVFGSQIDFDYLELGAHAEVELGRIGISRVSGIVGAFVNSSDLRLLEHKYFRGSDRYFFSDPLKSMQLLGPTLHTPHSFLQSGYIHHFNGFLMNKVPYNRVLKLAIAGGAAILAIPDASFYHAEVFAGFERNIPIKKQLIRLGVYVVSSANTVEKGNFTLKFGFDFYNFYSGKWNY